MPPKSEVGSFLSSKWYTLRLTELVRSIKQEREAIGKARQSLFDHCDELKDYEKQLAEFIAHEKNGNWMAINNTSKEKIRKNIEKSTEKQKEAKTEYLKEIVADSNAE